VVDGNKAIKKEHGRIVILSGMTPLASALCFQLIPQIANAPER
jgi:hypothetical protein